MRKKYQRKRKEQYAYQDGGMQSQYSKTMYPLLNKELSYPILRVEPSTQGGVEGYKQYYTDPNSPDADYSFLSKEDYLRKKNAKEGSKDYEPYLNMYLKRTGNREGINVSYEDGGEYLPQYQNGGWNNNQAYPFTPTLNNQNYMYSTPGNEILHDPVNNNPYNFNYSSGKRAPNESAVGDSALKAQNQPDNTTTVTEEQSGMNTNQPRVQSINKVLGQEFAPKESNTESTNNNNSQPHQFFNPYGGVDIPTAASVLGSSIASGNTFGTVMAGLKLGTGLARNFLGGMGQQRVANRANQRMAEDTRDAITRTNRVNNLREEGWNEGTGRFYGQDGGEMSQEQGSQEEQMVMQVAEALQQGMPPEEVLQQLMQMGLDEAQATQLIQMVMQQLQGQAPQQEMKCGGKKYEEGGKYLEMLKNKRIKNYTFNSETNSYDIEFED